MLFIFIFYITHIRHTLAIPPFEVYPENYSYHLNVAVHVYICTCTNIHILLLISSQTTQHACTTFWAQSLNNWGKKDKSWKLYHEVNLLFYAPGTAMTPFCGRFDSSQTQRTTHTNARTMHGLQTPVFNAVSPLTSSLFSSAYCFPFPLFLSCWLIDFPLVSHLPQIQEIVEIWSLKLW